MLLIFIASLVSLCFSFLGMVIFSLMVDLSFTIRELHGCLMLHHIFLEINYMWKCFPGYCEVDKLEFFFSFVDGSMHYGHWDCESKYKAGLAKWWKKCSTSISHFCFYSFIMLDSLNSL